MSLKILRQYEEELERFELVIVVLERVSGRCFLCKVSNVTRAIAPAGCI